MLLSNITYRVLLTQKLGTFIGIFVFHLQFTHHVNSKLEYEFRYFGNSPAHYIEQITILQHLSEYKFQKNIGILYKYTLCRVSYIILKFCV